METKVTEFERYLAVLSAGLQAGEAEKEEICSEIGQNLYDKYYEFLIKGHGLEESVRYTLDAFEEPDALAGMFNRSRKPGLGFGVAADIINNRGIMLAAVVATILTALIV